MSYFNQLTDRLSDLYDSLDDEVLCPEVKSKNKVFIDLLNKEVKRLINK